jgi:hypothetical protein
LTAVETLCAIGVAIVHEDCSALSARLHERAESHRSMPVGAARLRVRTDESRKGRAMPDMKWILLIVLASQVFLYAARVPLQRAISSLGEALAGAFAHSAKWWKDLAREMTKRGRELALEHGRDGAEGKIAREFHRIDRSYARDLAELPTLSRKLDDLIAKAEADYATCGVTPPPAPQWMDLVSTVNNMPRIGSDGIARKFVDEIQKSVTEAEKKAHAEFRDLTSRRHKITVGGNPQSHGIDGPKCRPSGPGDVADRRLHAALHRDPQRRQEHESCADLG